MIDELRIGMLVQIFNPLNACFIEAHAVGTHTWKYFRMHLLKYSKKNVERSDNGCEKKLNNHPQEFPRYALVLPIWPLVVNDLIENKLTSRTSHKLQVNIYVCRYKFQTFLNRTH